MTEWGIQIASEKKMRSRASSLTDNPLTSEMALFLFSLQSGGEEIRSAPFVYIPDLKKKVYALLEKNDRYWFISWHDGRIPADEVWIKIGGDKGGSSFKASVQIFNVEHPNSVNNTCVFTVFQAADTVFNLHVALDRFVEQVDDLQRSQWRFAHNY
jgi:hypothetical protein